MIFPCFYSLHIYLVHVLYHQLYFQVADYLPHVFRVPVAYCYDQQVFYAGGQHLDVTFVHFITVLHQFKPFILLSCVFQNVLVYIKYWLFIRTQIILVLVTRPNTEVSQCLETLIENFIKLYFQFWLTFNVDHYSLVRIEIDELFLFYLAFGEKPLLYFEVINHRWQEISCFLNNVDVG